MADLHAGCVQQDVDPGVVRLHLARMHGIDCLAVGEVDLMPVGAAPGAADCVDRVGRGLCPLEVSEFEFDAAPAWLAHRSLRCAQRGRA